MTHHRIRDIKGKAIVDLRNGVKIGVFDDLMISPDQLASKLLVTNSGNVFNRRIEGIRVEDVRVWGRDVILVENQDVLQPLTNYPDHKSWVLATEQIKQLTVVSIDGKRVGQVDDLMLDDHGRITGVALSQVFIKGPLEKTKEISTDAIRSLGPDVVIVDLDRVQTTGLVDEADLAPEGGSTLHTPYAPDRRGDGALQGEMYDGGARIYDGETVRR